MLVLPVWFTVLVVFFFEIFLFGTVDVAGLTGFTGLIIGLSGLTGVTGGVITASSLLYTYSTS